MKTKHKIVLWICLLLVIIIVICVVLIRQAEKEQNDSGTLGDVAATTSSSAVSTPLVSASPSIQKYISEGRNFELDFPASWGEVNIARKDVEGGKATTFSFKTTDPAFVDGTAVAVTIFEYPLSSDLKSGILLKSDGNYNYSYLTWEQPPTDHQQITEKELADVLKTFRLTR